MSGGRRHSVFKRTAFVIAGVACAIGLVSGVQALQADPAPSSGIVIQETMGEKTLGERTASGSSGSNLPTASEGTGAVLEPAVGMVPLVTETVAYGASYGSVEIPRFGADWSRPLLEGTGADVIDSYDDKGRFIVSRYPSSEPFGASRNVGIAGHSGSVYDLDLLESLTGNYDDESLSYSPFTRMDELAAGDSLIVASSAGRYTYNFLWSEVVNPEQNEVVYEQVYRSAERKPGEEINTQALVVTTCGVLDNWNGDTSIRRIYYFELVGFEPSS